MNANKIYKMLIPVKWKVLRIYKISPLRQAGLISIAVIVLAGIFSSIIKNINMNKSESLMLQEIVRLIHDGERVRARALCEKAIKLFSSVQARYLLGLIQLDEKNFAGAKESLDEAFKMSPSSGEYLLARAVAEYFSGELEECFETMRSSELLMSRENFDGYLNDMGLLKLKKYFKQGFSTEVYSSN